MVKWPAAVLEYISDHWDVGIKMTNVGHTRRNVRRVIVKLPMFPAQAAPKFSLKMKVEEKEENHLSRFISSE